MIRKLLTELRMLGALEFFNDSNPERVYDEQFVIELLENEQEWRRIEKNNRRLKQAKFSTRKDWSTIDPTRNPQINFEMFKQYGKGDFVKQKRNLCLIGAPGLAKTHILLAIGNDLCCNGFTVAFYTASDLVTMLSEAQSSKELSKAKKKLLKPDLLIIDELGFFPLLNEAAELLFDVFSSRYERGSIAVSTNLSLPKWGTIFKSKELAQALVDRFVQYGDIYVLKGPSYRLLEAKEHSSKK
ncbi:MAG: ATP-binding protein [Holosporales bacterium]|jgi:DNA replication protein DnaC|nr:ATP-binding protein [Holosporales bacterium]